ncbi:MAG: PAT family beta-lactamase induction signal transducer AmpG [Rhodothermales bacterium]|jgi:PAT family beta-lactamase induction signal transducer AmpG
MTETGNEITTARGKSRSPWSWIPSLYLAEGLPYVVIMTVSVIMYKRLEISNTEIALYTSWLYLPWVIKPLWSPFVDLIKTKRLWVVAMQLLIGGGLAGVALTVPTGNFFQYSLAFLWLMAFSSATHDIAADGFYMLGLSSHDQAWFVGIRSTFYRLAMLAGQGLLVMLAGYLEVSTGSIPVAWSVIFFVLAGVFVGFALLHYWSLPHPEEDVPKPYTSMADVWAGFYETFRSFFQKPGIGLILAFLLFYRFAEAQLVKMASPFLLDERAVGGLGLSTGEVGFVYGTVGLLALTVGGILGGMAAAKSGLKAWLWWMVAAINLPNAVYILLSWTAPESFWVVNVAVAVEQFGYGFGFTAYMLYMIYVADGPNKTSHFAICTGFMALGMMLPGMVSGMIQESLGYEWFFVWVLLATIPGFIVSGLVPLDAEFGKSENPAG